MNYVRGMLDLVTLCIFFFYLFIYLFIYLFFILGHSISCLRNVSDNDISLCTTIFPCHTVTINHSFSQRDLAVI